MLPYSFFSAMLRFVAAKTEAAATDARTAEMAAVLRRIADTVDQGPEFEVPGDGLELNARALAGFAAFLQRSILPEAVAHGNQAGENQIRWSVDAAMDAVNTLLSRAALQEGQERQAVRITLPAPPP
ncbi:hypothetical protein [Paramagnetospirillum magneticum]|uniref:Uncharacterized protein n=1 Tax=Paramagnetospirillum magneticum (strain ATCC 700264 / AMB-1) TaxID=342108 RepID=Q2W2M9_PARM1|nr:hypothetical protein [Paramagnetospirillum magneticum]BAE51896.1 hypothetical protein amb3092 [Paramagnetospirillum magneticum AMB-1]